MIIRTNVAPKKPSNTFVKEEEKVSKEVVVKPVKSEKKKKVTPAPVVEEPVVEVVEEDKIDLSEWLKEDEIED